MENITLEDLVAFGSIKDLNSIFLESIGIVVILDCIECDGTLD